VKIITLVDPPDVNQIWVENKPPNKRDHAHLQL